MCSSINLLIFLYLCYLQQALYCKPEAILSHIVQNYVDKTSLSTSKCMPIYAIIMHIVTHLFFSYFQNYIVCGHGCVLFTLI